MIAGVGSIDLGLLVVAADDGWMPQTEEHVQILTYLGVERAVVALTKSDLGGIDAAARQLRDRLGHSKFANAQIIATSVRSGDGIETLKRALASEFATMHPPRDYGKPRLFIDRVFTLRGIGTVATGTLAGGQLRRDQKIVVQPGNLHTRIRSIQSHGRDLDVKAPNRGPEQRLACRISAWTKSDGETLSPLPIFHLQIRLSLFFSKNQHAFRAKIRACGR